VSEQVFFIFWGLGANGKGTITNAFLDMLGDYGVKATPDLLMLNRNGSHPTERTKLCGARIVITSETEENYRLAEAFMKEATGGDPITARRMREDFWTFKPTHKIFLATNHKPVIRGTDHAIWRRPKLLPFTVTIPREDWDMQLPEKLKYEWPGILAWAARGCLDWHQNGLGIPDEVESATQEYRNDMDILGSFLEECCVIDPGLKVGSTDLYSEYKEWCSEQGISRPWTQKDVGRSLMERGFSNKRMNTGYHWYGLGLRGPYAPDDPRNYPNDPDNSPENPENDIQDNAPSCSGEPSTVHPSPDEVNHLDPDLVLKSEPVNRSEPKSALTEILIPRIEVNPKIGSPRFTVHPYPVNSNTEYDLYSDHPDGSDIITEVSEVEDLVEQFSNEKEVYLDLETTGLDPRRDRIRTVQLGTKEQARIIDAFAVPVTKLMPLLKPLLEGGPVKIGQNLKFDWQFLYEQRIFMHPVFDTMIADQVIHHRNYGRGLLALVKDYLDLDISKVEQTSDWTGELTQAQINYAKEDVRVLPPLADAIMEKARELKLERTIDLENQALPGIAWMEAKGVAFDLDSWNLLAQQAEAKVKELVIAMDQIAFEYGGLDSMDWASPKRY
jgi:P4 family phage/plasmid primase-like protien